MNQEDGRVVGTGVGGAVGDGRLLAGRYLLGARLGRGGMGTVWRARDEMLDREVAVKELSVGHLSEEDLYIVQSRMKQEARAAARIKHPGVITIHDVLEQDGKPWIVMELVDGRSLAELVEQEGPLAPRDAAQIGAKVLAALHTGHRAGVLHRDVKPANVLLERGTGRVVLTDFGIATYEGDSALTRTGDLIGSPDYLPPERVHGTRPGPESDLWGLGATLYAAVEGRSPFKRDTPLTTLAAVVSEPLPEPARAGALAPVLRALLAKEPAQRPPAEQAIRMLESVASGHTMAVRGAALPKPGPVELPWEEAVAGGAPAPDSVPAALREPTGAIPLADRADGGAAGPASARQPDALPTAPTEVRPAAPVSAAPPRRGRGRFGAVLAVTGLAAAVAAAAVSFGLLRWQARDSAAGGGNPPSGTASAGASTPAGTSGATPPGQAVPQGYRITTDPEGFSFALPSTGRPWVHSEKNAGEIDYTPDRTLHLLRFGVTRGQALSPVQHARQMSEDHLSKGLRGYRLLGLSSTVFNGSPAAFWSFTYTAEYPGTTTQYTRYSQEEIFRNARGTEYAIYVAYPLSEQTAAQQFFTIVLNSFSTR